MEADRRGGGQAAGGKGRDISAHAQKIRAERNGKRARRRSDGQVFQIFEEAGESRLNGKLFKHYRLYKGSSEFDTREMSVFIDGIVSEAKALGIQTETPEELLNIKSLWETGGK